MDHFTYKNSLLHAEQVAITKIAAEIGTPFYCYSAATLRRHFQVFAEGLKGRKAKICYAVKANDNLSVLRVLKEAGAGADVVSEGEIRKCLAAGFTPQDIVFSGVGKTDAEIAYALQKGIFQLNVESEPELEAISRIAKKLKKTAPVCLRVNPDVAGGGHAKITVGRKQDKFGIDANIVPKLFDRAAKLPGVKLVGISCHIGSQITDVKPFRAAFAKMMVMVKQLEKRGHTLARLDLGGGLGILYEGRYEEKSEKDLPPLPLRYLHIAREETKDFKGLLMFEPGRVIVGNAGILVASVVRVKPTDTRNFLILDAGMNDLIRPSFYDAHHDIIPVRLKPGTKQKAYDIVGPVCETGDTFARGRDLAALKEGDLVAFRSAGAYGATMASTYNARPLVPEVLVDGKKWKVARRRQTYAELIALDSAPK